MGDVLILGDAVPLHATGLFSYYSTNLSSQRLFKAPELVLNPISLEVSALHPAVPNSHAALSELLFYHGKIKRMETTTEI
jgi:hypothetical protein